ncbi:MAG: OB-fold nucleic acid binding domain-containing protein, partial [Gemmatimonadetes bacterium]|nr:OB-fold nucleic acid binding domain-containing protein [Gemmatimonadota bacterium]
MSQPFARIDQLSQFADQSVTVRGWVTHLRSSGKVAFIVMRDGSGVLQCVLVKKQLPEDDWARFAELTLEASVAVTGDVR